MLCLNENMSQSTTPYCLIRHVVGGRAARGNDGDVQAPDPARDFLHLRLKTMHNRSQQLIDIGPSPTSCF